jgi:hypothetical protein
MPEILWGVVSAECYAKAVYSKSLVGPNWDCIACLIGRAFTRNVGISSSWEFSFSRDLVPDVSILIRLVRCMHACTCCARIASWSMT